jgi:tetratricopeptide (TPR) repeat protein
MRARVLTVIAPITPPPRRALSVFMALGAWLALQTPGPLAALPPDNGSDVWIRVDTAHLTLFSDASEEATVEIGRRMEQFRAVLAHLGPDLSPDSPLPTWVFVFKDDLAFRPYKLLQKGRHAGMPANVDGFFVQEDDGNFIGVNATPDSSPWPVIYHEYFHFFLSNNFDDIPLWFNEGMAQCYSTFRMESGALVIGGRLENEAQWLRVHPLMPLARLQSITFDSPDYHEAGKQETFYAQSWAMVHYLLWGPARPAEGGAGFLHGLKRGTSLKEALAPLTTASDPDLEQHVAAYIKKSRYSLSVMKHETVPYDDAARAAPLERAQLLYRLGDFLLHVETDRAREAQEHLEEAIRLDPRLAAAHADLGRILAGRRLHAEAQAEFEKAIALDPANQALSLAYGYALIDQAMPSHVTEIRLGTSLPPEIARARELFQAATRTAPDVAEAWAGLGSTYLYDPGDLAPGIAALERAYRSMPTRIDIAHNLAELCAHAGQRARAQELIERVLDRSEDPEVRAAGRSILFRGDLAGVEALAAKGETEAAVARLRALQASPLSPQEKATVQARLDSLEQFATQKGALDQYNAAVEKVNAKEYDAAAAILEKFRDSGSDPEVAAKAKELLAQVRDVQTVNRALSLANGGDYARAVAMLQKVARESKDRQIVRQARDLAANIETTGQMASYNQALDKFKGKDYAGAIAILDRLIAGTKDAALAEKARDLRGWAKQGLAGQPAPSR